MAVYTLAERHRVADEGATAWHMKGTSDRMRKVGAAARAFK